MWHRHWLITSAGSTPLEYDDEAPIVAYGGYIRSDDLPPLSSERPVVEYGGLAITDRTGCPGCFDQ